MYYLVFMQSHNKAPVNWTEFILVYTVFSRSLNQFITSPPSVQLAYSLFNLTEWKIALNSAKISSNPSLQAILWSVCELCLYVYV